jgi:hypothetical protein
MTYEAKIANFGGSFTAWARGNEKKFSHSEPQIHADEWISQIKNQRHLLICVNQRFRQFFTRRWSFAIRIPIGTMGTRKRTTHLRLSTS